MALMDIFYAAVIFLALSLLPIIFRAFLLIHKTAKNGIKNQNPLSIDVPLTSMRHKKLYYAGIALYAAMTFASFIWLEISIIDAIADRMAVPAIFFIILVCISIGAFGCYVLYIFRKRTKTLNKYPPPGPGASEGELIDWENKSFDENAHKFSSKKAAIIAGAFIGYLLLWVTAMVIVGIVLD